MTTVGEAKRVARDWVIAEVAGQSGVVGAVFHGSVNWMADEDELPATSDIDVLVVVEPGSPWRKPGKFRVDGVLLEVSDLPAAQVRDAGQVLSTHHLAGTFRVHGVILDPTGHLSALQATVAEGYARPEWVRRRVASARARVVAGLRDRADGALEDEVIAWVFPAAITAHVALVAGLRNPTVRSRYVALRDLLAGLSLGQEYDGFLALVGARDVTGDEAATHLRSLRPAFDDAARLVRSPFPFAADLSDDGRAVAIDGTAALIAAGDHREAMFWLVVTWARCMQVLAADGVPADYERHLPAFRALLRLVGVRDSGDLVRGHERTRAALPWVDDVAERVLARCGQPAN